LPFVVYVLRSQSNGRRYVGQTEDLTRRLAEHNDPEHNPRKFTTRIPGPWELIHHESYATRAEAMRRERWLKSGVGRAWLDQLNGRTIAPQAD
jgi:putative endonuclease